MPPDPPPNSPAATRGASAAQPGFGSWSTQPPRYGNGQLSRSLLVVVGCVAVVLAVAVVLIVRFDSAQPRVPDTRALLVPVPADALACGRDGRLFSADRVAHGDAVPVALSLMVNRSGLLSVAYRCWLRVGGYEVDVMLLRFDTAEHAARVVPVDPAVVLPDLAEVPGVPGAHSFRLLAWPDRLWAVVGARATTAFAILETLGSGTEVNAIEEIAFQQYVRL